MKTTHVVPSYLASEILFQIIDLKVNTLFIGSKKLLFNKTALVPHCPKREANQHGETAGEQRQRAELRLRQLPQGVNSKLWRRNQSQRTREGRLATHARWGHDQRANHVRRGLIEWQIRSLVHKVRILIHFGEFFVDYLLCEKFQGW